MPCASVIHCVVSVDIYCDTLATISAVISTCKYQSIVLGGDLNYDFNVDGPAHDVLSTFMDSLKLVPTCTRLQGPVLQSYRHASLQASSLIDHFLV